MIFKKPDPDFSDYKSDNVKPRLKQYLEGLDEFCKSKKLPEIVITSLMSKDDPHMHESEHYDGEAADIRAHHLKAPQLAKMFLWASEHFFRKETNADGMQLRCFYPHGEGDNFHVHLSIDHLG